MRTMNSKSRHLGMSLIELMVAIVMGMIVLGGVIALVVATIRTNNDNMRMTRLTQELRGAMQLITRDLRRAGFSRDALLDVGTGTMANPFIGVDYSDADGDGFDDDDCLLYSYDGKPGLNTVADVNGTLESDGSEQHGVRYDADNLAIDYKNGSASACGDSAGWEPMTDPKAVEITALAFGVPAGATAFPDFPTVTTAGFTVTVREIQVTISGRLTDDPTVTRTIQDTVRVRNDLFEPPPPPP